MIYFQYCDGWDAKLAYENHLLSNQDAKKIIEKIINIYAAEKCLLGLFSALSVTEGRLSPFTATHDYCVKIKSFNSAENIELIISPIYLLGPDYPAQYKEKHGEELDKSAIIGLLEISINDHLHFGHKTYRLGIDAGIVFRNSKISHNKNMSLSLHSASDGIMATLSCESQTTSKKFSWRLLGSPDFLKPTKPNLRVVQG